MLSANDVRTLETLHSLKKLVTSDHRDFATTCCTKYVAAALSLYVWSLTWSIFLAEKAGTITGPRPPLSFISERNLQAGLVHLSNSCRGLATTEIGTVWKKHDISMAQALQGFLQLGSLNVTHDCGQGCWTGNFVRHRYLNVSVFPVWSCLKSNSFSLLCFGKTLQHVHIVLWDELLRARRSARRSNVCP